MPKKTKVKERGFASYFPKICKAQNTAAKSDVHAELQKMTSFLLDAFVKNGSIVLNEYAVKDETVKPRVMQAVLETTLHGDLRTAAIEAGLAAELERVKKAKAEKKEEAAASVGAEA